MGCSGVVLVGCVSSALFLEVLGSEPAAAPSLTPLLPKVVVPCRDCCDTGASIFVVASALVSSTGVFLLGNIGESLDPGVRDGVAPLVAGCSASAAVEVSGTLLEGDVGSLGVVFTGGDDVLSVPSASG